MASRGTFVSCPESFVSSANVSNRNLFTPEMNKSGQYGSGLRFAP
jgi:hypothetical protein